MDKLNKMKKTVTLPAEITLLAEEFADYKNLNFSNALAFLIGRGFNDLYSKSSCFDFNENVCIVTDDKGMDWIIFNDNTNNPNHAYCLDEKHMFTRLGIELKLQALSEESSKKLDALLSEEYIDSISDKIAEKIVDRLKNK